MKNRKERPDNYPKPRKFPRGAIVPEYTEKWYEKNQPGKNKKSVSIADSRRKRNGKEAV